MTVNVCVGMTALIMNSYRQNHRRESPTMTATLDSPTHASGQRLQRISLSYSFTNSYEGNLLDPPAPSPSIANAQMKISGELKRRLVVIQRILLGSHILSHFSIIQPPTRIIIFIHLQPKDHHAFQSRPIPPILTSLTPKLPQYDYYG